MTKTNKGLVIALDGSDGVGKTTQVDLLVRALNEQGRTVHKTRSSGGTPIGEALRQVSLSEAPRPPLTDFYISLAMAEALGDDIQTRKQKGEAIVIDRSPLAIVAYNGYGSDLDNKQITLQACRAMVKHWQIDVLIVLTASQTVLDQRRSKRKTEDYFERQGQSYHKRVRAGYEAGVEFLKANSDVVIVEIDAGDSIAVVQRRVLASLE